MMQIATEDVFTITQQKQTDWPSASYFLAIGRVVEANVTQQQKHRFFQSKYIFDKICQWQSIW